MELYAVMIIFVSFVLTPFLVNDLILKFSEHTILFLHYTSTADKKAADCH